jgi:hypothetical protein
MPFKKNPDRSLVLSHFLTNFLQNLALCQTSFILGGASYTRTREIAISN